MEHERMNITEYEHGSMRLFAARTGAKDLVTMQGSVLGGHYMLSRALDMVPRLASDVFDAGTKSRNKEAIRMALSARGASMHFSSGGDRTYFSATCLPEDVDFMAKLIAECLREALFPTAELSSQKKRTLAELEESKTKTRGLASNEFFRLIYDRSHVNYVDTLPEYIARTKKTERKDLLSYQKLLGKGGLVCAITGDIVPDVVLKKVERAFASLPGGTPVMTEKKQNTEKPRAKESEIAVPDKANIDVFMGAHVPLTYDSPEFLSFTVLTDMLGGRGLSGGHLMRTIRERDGLTYGIYASAVGFGGRADGALQVGATFSPATYQKAVEATEKEIRVFLDKGITESALQAKKGEMTGKYVVGLATSGGLAGKLHTIGVREKPLSYIDEYPSLIKALSVRDIRNAATLVPWDSFVVSAAGTFENKK